MKAFLTKALTPESDAAAIAAAINAGNHGYTAAAMTGADAGKVKITQPAAPTKDVDVNSAAKARESIAANCHGQYGYCQCGQRMLLRMQQRRR